MPLAADRKMSQMWPGSVVAVQPPCSRTILACTDVELQKPIPVGSGGGHLKRSREGHVVVVWLILGALLSARPTLAQSGPGVSGQSTFGLYCATCHGTSAKGDGPLASSMSLRPADLTRIAERNRGTFPADQVARIIDGRRPVKGHGGGDMPVWGDAFAKTADPTPVDEKIRRLVAYLESIQIKP